MSGPGPEVPTEAEGVGPAAARGRCAAARRARLAAGGRVIKISTHLHPHALKDISDHGCDSACADGGGRFMTLRPMAKRALVDVQGRQVGQEVVAHLGVDIKVILTPPCIICMENH